MQQPLMHHLVHPIQPVVQAVQEVQRGTTTTVDPLVHPVQAATAFPPSANTEITTYDAPKSTVFPVLKNFRLVTASSGLPFLSFFFFSFIAPSSHRVQVQLVVTTGNHRQWTMLAIAPGAFLSMAPLTDDPASMARSQRSTSMAFFV